MPDSVVRPEYGPSLPALVRARVGRLPRAAQVALAIVVLAAVAGVLVAVREAGDTHYVRSEPFEFNFRYPDALKRVAPRPGELVRLEQRRDGRFVQSFALSPIALPDYTGDPGGILPVVAARLIDAGPRRYPGFEPSQEGRARVVKAAGYSVAFRARLGERSLLGRLVLLPRPGAHPRQAVLMELLGTPSAGTTQPEDVGAAGLVKIPFRSFRFGTKGP